jgi:hypothetical protein
MIGKKIKLYRFDEIKPTGKVKDLQFFDNREDALHYKLRGMIMWGIEVPKENTKFIKTAGVGNILTWSGEV